VKVPPKAACREVRKKERKMGVMVYRESFKIQSNDKICTFHDVTDQAGEALDRSGIKDGILVVYSRHTTCGVITQERAHDMSMTGLETLQQDLVDVFEAAVPVCRKEGTYLHPGPEALKFADAHGEDARGSAIIGRNETITVIDGKMDLGDNGRVYFIDFDQTRARERTVQVMVIGE